MTIELDFEGEGIGKLLVPLVVRRQVKGELPRNAQNLKDTEGMESYRLAEATAGKGVVPLG